MLLLSFFMFSTINSRRRIEESINNNKYFQMYFSCIPPFGNPYRMFCKNEEKLGKAKGKKKDWLAV